MKQTSDEKVMVVRSWHSRAHSLLSSARRAQPKEVSSASHSSSLLSSAIHSSSLLSSARRAQLCGKRSVQLCARGQLIQESSALPKEVRSALRKRSAHPGELSSDQRSHLSSAQEVSSSRRAQLCLKRSAQLCARG